jgi:putative endonuclease
VSASPSRDSRKSPRSNADAGLLAEHLVAEWLKEQGWEILYRRWHCLWGELDLVACATAIALPSHLAQPSLAFVEVKARSKRNWDQNGLLAITPQKQAKLGQAAQLFLAAYPQFADCPCRFDIALVYCQALPHPPARESLNQLKQLNLEMHQASTASNTPTQLPQSLSFPSPIHLGQSIVIAGYRLSLQQYLPAAFSVET